MDMEITPELRQWAVEQANVLLQRGQMDEESLRDTTKLLIETAKDIAIFVANGWDDAKEREYLINVAGDAMNVVANRGSASSVQRLHQSLQRQW